MKEIKLDVQIRDQIGSRKIKVVRREDFVPAIVYGGSRKETPVKMDRRSYERIRRLHQGESLVFHLNVLEGKKKLRDYSAIIKEEQLNPVTDQVLHVDFKRISLKEQIEVKVPIVTKGESVGVKRDGGSVDQMLWELDIVCLPTRIPAHFEVNVSEMEIGDSVHVKDIVLPVGVITKHDPEAFVLSVIPPRKEEIVEPLPEGAEPEVIKEEEEEGGEKKPEEGTEKKEENKEGNKEEKKTEKKEK